MSYMIYLILFLSQIVFLFFISRHATNCLFRFLRSFIKNEKIVFSLVSLIYLPGTILHEIGHLFAAMVLFLKVRDINIFPEFEENYIKLGSVLYEKRDFVRGFLVGVAPFFAGILFFYFISVFNLFPSVNLVQNFFVAYLIFSISSTMFSSKQDLIDFIFMIPFFIFVAGFVYIFQINLNIIFFCAVTFF